MIAGLFFLYGTLKDRSLLAAAVGKVSVRSVGNGTVRGTLYNAGDYPALVLGGTCEVPGELFEVSDFDAVVHRLDAYEGVAQGLYSRQRTRVNTTDETRLAWAYVYEGDVDGLPTIDSWPTSPDAQSRFRQSSTWEGQQMVEKSIELTGISANSIEEAVQLAVARAAVTIDSVRRAEVIDVSADLEDGEVVSWRVRTRITFAVLDRLHE